MVNAREISDGFLTVTDDKERISDVRLLESTANQKNVVFRR